MRPARCLLLVALFALAGCDDDSMTTQWRYGTYARAPLFTDGTAAQPIPDGAVAQGDLDRSTASATPPAVDAALLARGHERFDIYCSPCHGLAGNADGMIVQRGFPAPPSFHSTRLRALPAQQIFDTISRGYGVMYAYGSRIEPRDRWAIVAYVRALQQSQHTDVASVPDLRAKLP